MRGKRAHPRRSGHHLQHDPRIRGNRGHVLYRRKTIDYLRLTGRSAENVHLVETYAKAAGLWADDMTGAQYERVLEFDLSTVVRNIAGPSNPHRRVATEHLASAEIAGEYEEQPGQMPDGAVIIAAITSCTNTSNPRNVIAAGLLAKKANAMGLQESLGENIAGTRIQSRPAVLGRGRTVKRARGAWLRDVASPARPVTA